jgi:site-specific DNA recombinase
MTGVRELVLRDLYRGRIVWGKTRWIDRGGTKHKVGCPEAEWLTVEKPELRIIDEALWRAAHARLDRPRAAYTGPARGRSLRRPASGVESSYLLTGVLRVQTLVPPGDPEGLYAAIRGLSRAA